jgi:hypothetical protein
MSETEHTYTSCDDKNLNNFGYNNCRRCTDLVIKEWHNQKVQITQLQAEVEALRKHAAWQPIKTAPKDGTEILVLFKRFGVKCVAWTTVWGDPTDENAHWHIDDNKNDPYPLRGYSEGDEMGWLPLPKPPIAGEAT